MTNHLRPVVEREGRLFPRLVGYRAVYNEFVLATINVMFETNGILISKCMVHY